MLSRKLLVSSITGVWSWWRKSCDCSSNQIPFTMLRTKETSIVDSPDMENRKLGRLGVGGVTWKVVSTEDQTSCWIRVWYCVPLRL